MKVKVKLAIILAFISHSVFSQSGKETVFSIDSIFALVEQNSTQLKMSQTLVETAQHAVSVAENKRLPTVDVELSALYLGNATILDRNFSNAQNATMPHFGNNFSIEASYVVFAGRAITNSITKAKLEEQIAVLAHKKSMSDMRFLVAGYYLDLYKLYNQRKVFLKNIEQTEVMINQIRAKQTEGMALANDLTRYELMLQNLKLSLIEIENNISIINQHLVITLGLPNETIIAADTTIQNTQLAPKSTDSLLQIAEKNRTELQTAELNNAIAEKQVAIAKANYYPSLAVVAADNMNGPITIEIPPINKNLNYWYVGVGLKYNLASLYKSSKEVRLAKSSQNATLYAQKAELEHTQTAIYSAQTKFLESFEMLHTYEKTFQLATENYTVINNRYQQGLVLITEMLDASNMKLNAELQVVNANLTIIYNHYKLLREIGIL
jgi:outer membrane protein TolC